VNDIPQFTTQIDGLRIHFVHAKAKRPSKTAILFLHGWPGTFLECRKLFPLLMGTIPFYFFFVCLFLIGFLFLFLEKKKKKDGLVGDEGFDVICPSLPGYGFSEAPKERGKMLEC
jgi:microsomal epoxide hydrolase